tara:strand:- start:4976 stop:5185 length:210 start_codon:yes stop_codon:yes gene_type:complete
MSKNMARLYEKAWNQVVNKLPQFKKDIIINNFPYENRSDKRIADDVTKEAIKLAESWEWEESHILSGKN